LAWHLARAGRRVVVLERAHAGSGASSRNVGRVRSIQLTPELTRVGLAAQAKHARLGQELGQNTLFWRAGYMWVLYTDEEVERFRALLPMLAEERCPAKLIAANQVLKHMPVLRGGERPRGAMYGARDAIVHHDAVMYAYRHACMNLGVALREHAEVTAIETRAGRASAVHCRDTRVDADAVVIAAGGWSSQVGRLADLQIPNTPYRREAFVTESMRPFMSAAVTFYSPTEGWFNQTLRGELVAGSISDVEPPGLNHAASPASVQQTGSLLLRKAPLLGGLRVVRQWAGVYDMTPDKKPLVGPSRISGLYLFNGCNGRGFNLGPILAQLLAEELVTGRRDRLLEGFEATRFDGTNAKVDLAGGYYAGYSNSEPSPHSAAAVE
jgi:sarcosine oxidase subunit beta